MIDSGEEISKEEIALICQACWHWMGVVTVMPEWKLCQKESDLKKLKVAVAKLSRNEYLTGIPRESPNSYQTDN